MPEVRLPEQYLRSLEVDVGLMMPLETLSTTHYQIGFLLLQSEPISTKTSEDEKCGLTRLSELIHCQNMRMKQMNAFKGVLN